MSNHPSSVGDEVHYSVRLPLRQLLFTINTVTDERDSAVLGRELADARANRGSSLKTVSTVAGISAAYLQKLERGQVESPSPRILRSLAQHLDLPYERLMRLAGYALPSPEPLQTAGLAHVLKDARLTQGEEQAVAAFVELLINQRHKPSGS